jgi:prolyl-tRNA synthetase
VGNVFDLGQKYGKDFGLAFTDRAGKRQYPVMGCYGIGISRLMGVIVEEHHDDRGIVWPESAAPFRVHLLELGKASGKKVYGNLVKRGIDTLYDDRAVSAGEKLNDADLVGIPYRAVVSEKTGARIELKARSEKAPKIVTEAELLKRLADPRGTK